jgi:hypothetical protein
MKEFVDEKLDDIRNVKVFDGTSVGTFTKPFDDINQKFKNGHNENKQKINEENSVNYESNNIENDRKNENEMKNKEIEINKDLEINENKNKDINERKNIKINNNNNQEINFANKKLFLNENVTPQLKQGLLSSLLAGLSEHVNTANVDVIESLLKDVLTQFAAEQALRHLEER